MPFKLTFEDNPNQDDVQVLIRGITDHAKKQKGFNSLDFFAFFIRDEKNSIVGGCSGGTLYGGLHIDNLWVNDSIRNKGWGTKLINAALTYGKEKNCKFSTVNTMDWEALGLYQKLGFKIEFKRTGFHKNSVFYFLRQEFLQGNLSTEQIEIYPFKEKHIPLLVREFARHDWHKPQSTFDRYWHEQTLNERVIWVAFHHDQCTGYVTLKWESSYQSFKEQHIPEIMDLNVLPPYRHKGIGTRLLEIAEQLASTQKDTVGLGVGLYRDYGNAQRLYIKRGYVPDGLGVTYNYQPVVPGDSAPVDDDLVLWFTKPLEEFSGS
jgi:GNAT superfamily N-acetyltransferase